MARRVVDISEQQDDGKKRVVRHVFYGDSEAEAKHYEQSHRKADGFLDAALAGRTFKGIELSVNRIGRHPNPRGGRR